MKCGIIICTKEQKEGLEVNNVKLCKECYYVLTNGKKGDFDE